MRRGCVWPLPSPVRAPRASLRLDRYQYQTTSEAPAEGRMVVPEMNVCLPWCRGRCENLSGRLWCPRAEQNPRSPVRVSKERSNKLRLQLRQVEPDINHNITFAAVCCRYSKRRLNKYQVQYYGTPNGMLTTN